MNAYRIALILCRAVAVALWWSAGIRFVAAALTVLVSRIGLLTGGGYSQVTGLVLPSLMTVVLLMLGAVFLQVFAASLSAFIAGQSAFEGEAIASRHPLDKLERGLARAGAGLFLLFFGIANVLPTIAVGGYVFFFDNPNNTLGNTVMVYQLISIVPSVLQCVVGFVLAFSLGLRRLIKPQV